MSDRLLELAERVAAERWNADAEWIVNSGGLSCPWEQLSDEDRESATKDILSILEAADRAKAQEQSK